ncbi:hypothetical protein [Emergencia sp. 1XD21-10]|uniref:hypothetical protein n=1 Tax=Emergencia sp. 1XD21-10 TaxID=2304569 RepID=UPI001379A139|nr:hypothetical protein [Emergencia sp. 1XD21-10]NCF00154.1 hypothetical protein [Emergencia sp. 1XD21-10]
MEKVLKYGVPEVSYARVTGKALEYGVFEVPHAIILKKALEYGVLFGKEPVQLSDFMRLPCFLQEILLTALKAMIE